MTRFLLEEVDLNNYDVKYCNFVHKEDENMFKILLARQNLVWLILGVSLIVISCSSTNKTKSKESATIEIINNSRPDSNNSKDYYVVIHDMTKIKGGVQSLQENVRYPNEAKERNIQARVTVGVYVEKDGEVNEISIIDSPHPVLSREAKKAVRKTEFIPGKQMVYPQECS